MDLIKQIKEKFSKTPSDIEGIKELLDIRKFTEEELAELGISFTGNCFCEYKDAINNEHVSIKQEGLNSNYIIEVIQKLLEQGLNPNTIVDDENVMWNTMWIDAPNVGAALLKILLDHGGDPNHFISDTGETLFEYTAFKVSYDEYTHDYFNTVQCWLILMAYGGCWRNGKIPITMLGENTVDIFKDFQRYDYEIEQLPEKPGRYGCWRMHIYDIETKEEVAVY